MVCLKEFFLCFIVLSMFLPCSVDSAKRRSGKGTACRIAYTTPDSAGPVVKEMYKKRSPEEIFEAIHSVLADMSTDMDEFNFDRIHPHLKIIYALYNELRLLAVGNSDTLFGNSLDTMQDSIVQRIAYTTGRKDSNAPSVTFDSVLSESDSTVVVTTESVKSAPEPALKTVSLKPVVTPDNPDPVAIVKENLLGNTVSSSFALSCNDTSFSKYLLKFEIVQDSLGAFAWNIVFEKVDKLKNKTVKVHRYFDAGEFMISAQDLVWLNEAVKKSEIEILNYFHAKKSEKKDSL